FEYARRSGSHRIMDSAAANIGLAMFFGNTPTSAGLNRCHDLYDALEGHRRGRSLVDMTIGLHAAARGEKTIAQSRVSMSIEVSEELGQRIDLGVSSIMAAEVAQLGDDWDAAACHAELAVEIFRAAGAAPFMREATAQL